MASNLANLLHGDLDQLAYELDTCHSMTTDELRAALTNVARMLRTTQIHAGNMQREINELRQLITKGR